MLKLQRRFSWKLENSEEHADFHIRSNVYSHQVGAKLVHLGTSDTHKAFAVMLRTTPQDNTGVAHCLEHIALCGSQKYPVIDPFFKMLSRSLNSYMNAWTGSDFTMYPFSTKNHRDFDNLLDVYLDAVYNPLLSRHDFKQEAWRVEYSGEQLEYKGVVFNEMKGAMSDPANYLLHQMSSLLFQGSPYQYNSGGDPLEILKLTPDQLKAFHANFYHPSNSTFFFYGDQDIEKYLELLDSSILNKYRKNDVDTSVGAVPRRDAPLETLIKIPADPISVDSKTARFGISYVCNDLKDDSYTTFCMGVLSAALFEGQNSPMYKALLKSGLGKNYLPGTGYDSSTKEATFTIGVNGTDEKQSKEIEKAIMKTLKECMKTGIESSLIESAIHQIEIRTKEFKSNFGLLLISSMIHPTLHGGNPLEPLYINTYVNQLKKELASGKKVFQQLIEKLIWNNPHKIIFTAVPDSKASKISELQELKQLEQIEQALSEEGRQKLIGEAQELLDIQTQPQNVNLLPTLTVNDIEKHSEIINYTATATIDSIPIHFIEQPTNGISYLRMKIDLCDLPIELRPLLPLYSRLVNQIGTTKHSHGDFDNLKDLYTISGISASVIVGCSNDTIEEHTEQFVFKLGFLDRNTQNALDILTEFLIQLNFKEYEHIAFLIQKSVKARTDDIMNEGKSYGVSLSTSSLTSSANTFEGLSTLKHDCYLASQLLNSLSITPILSDFSSKLQEIHSFLMNKHRMSLLIHTSDMSNKEPLLERLEFLMNSMKLEYPNYNKPVQRSPLEEFEPFIYQAYFTLPMQVNYVVESFRGVSFNNPDYGPLTVLSNLMSLSMLFHEVREKGGAYGAGFVNDPFSGTLSLFSYRDPNSLKTFNSYEKVIRACHDGVFE